MSRPMPTEAAAIRYVTTLEAQWGCHSGPVRATPSPVEPVMHVRTEHNEWDVWFEDGELYGEC
jgi:hypothetical protein